MKYKLGETLRIADRSQEFIEASGAEVPVDGRFVYVEGPDRTGFVRVAFTDRGTGNLTKRWVIEEDVEKTHAEDVVMLRLDTDTIEELYSILYYLPMVGVDQTRSTLKELDVRN